MLPDRGHGLDLAMAAAAGLLPGARVRLSYMQDSQPQRQQGR